MRILALIAVISNAAPSQTSNFLHQEHQQDAFSRPAPALDDAQLRVFDFGNRLFNTNWAVAPAAAASFDGLGPTFNRVSCSACHLRDGRGRPPVAEENAPRSAVLRVSVPSSSAKLAAKLGAEPVAGYGLQINDQAITGVPPEASVKVLWSETKGTYASGETFRLRKPVIELTETKFGAMPKALLQSFRVAPAVFGLGLLEAIPAENILSAADPSDQNRDGISGRANLVWSESLGKYALGRFGWKAGTATLMDQNTSAAQSDIGLTSALMPDENCPDAQKACRAASSGGTPELSDAFITKLTSYTQMLGFPSARTLPKDGQKRFAEFHCAACHTPQQKTGSKTAFAQLQNQQFEPYTDLLLHDLGPGLADARPEFQADGREWRTAPLWGIGLIATVNQHELYLHDGRARGFAEAILWHGGEAQAAKDAFVKASPEKRAQLLAFLRAL
jgi:CxxC motif-containing protein (DUF1111 family)